MTAATIFWARGAAAQVVDSYFPAFVSTLAGDNVLSRPHPDYDSPGVRAGSFVIRPRVAEALGFDTNADGAPHGHSSLVVGSHASIGANSDWSRNSVNAFIGVDDIRYLSRAVQDQTNWTASVGGAYDIGRDRLSGSYTHLALTQAPGDLGTAGLNKKLPYAVDDVRLTYTIASRGALSFQPGIEVQNYQFGSALLANGLPDSAHNRTIEQGELTTRYEFSPGRNALLVIRGTHVEYTSIPAGSVGGSSNGATILAGLDYRATNLIRYRALAGYQVRDFQSRQVSNLSSPIIEASVIWSPTRLTTITGTARRDIEDAADENLGGFTYTAGRVSVDHELLRNVLLNAYVEWLHGDFHASGSSLGGSIFAQGASRQDVYDGAISVTWLLNRNLSATASYALTASNASGSYNYIRNVALITLAFGL